MGKASRWITNLLLGKKVNKEKRNYASLAVEYPITDTPSQQQTATCKVKRPWSFGRSGRKSKAHVYSRSIDSIDTTQCPIQIHHVLQNAAATKIQATFRSYLAKKALSALKSLVKLQSLVRGHLVRKQTTATLMRMHALMTIQVRARVQRIQMAEEAENVKRQWNFLQDGNGIRRANKKTVNMNIQEKMGAVKSKRIFLNHSENEGIEHGITKYYSENLSTMKQRHKYTDYPQNHPTSRASFSFEQPIYIDPLCLDLPNYMTNTESSRARVRSHSEPKRRPKYKSKAMALVAMDGQAGISASRSKHTTLENQDSWFIKLYDDGYDSTSIATSNSNYTRSPIAYEVVLPGRVSSLLQEN